MANLDEKPGVRTSRLYALSFIVEECVDCAGEQTVVAAPALLYPPDEPWISVVRLISLSHQLDSSSSATIVHERRFSILV